MGSGKPRWKLSFHRSSPSSVPSVSASASPRSSVTAEVPAEFVCPISGALMADPVIVPSGQTFERGCIQACRDLGFAPPAAADDVAGDGPFLVIPNVALKSAIVNWCDRAGLPHPTPLSTDAACAAVRKLKPSAPPRPPPAPAVDAALPSKSPFLEAAMSPKTPPVSVRANKGGRKVPSSSFSPLSSSSSSYHSSSSYSSSEIDETLAAQQENPKPPKPPIPADLCEADGLEEELLAKLVDSEPEEQEAALAALRSATRESRDRRIALCTPRLLAALRPMLLSRRPAVQANAAAALVNLSLEAPNKVPIVRSGAVPPLVEALTNGPPETRDHAAGAVFSLALEDENRAAIGVLGAIPPLIALFSRPSDGGRARRDAGMALYHLSLAGTNRSKIARAPGAVRALLAVAADEESSAAPAPQPSLRRVALMVVSNLAGCSEGRAALMDGGAVAAVVELMRAGAVGPAEEEYCVAALHGMSRGSLRFRGLARAAAAEKVLLRVAEAGAGGGRGDVGREMAKRTLRAMRGDDEGLPPAGSPVLPADGEEGSIVSDGLVSFRRRYKDFSSGSGVNSAQF